MFSVKEQRNLIMPLFLDQVFIVAVGLLATVMLSYAGEAAVSAVSLVDMINLLFVNVLIALASGGSIVVSQYVGRREPNQVRAAAGQLIGVNAAISTGILLLVVLLHRPMLRLFFGGVERDVMEAAITYFVLSGLSYPFLAIYHSCAALFRATGNSRTPMLTSIAMNLLSVAGSAVGIFVFRAGVAGAATAMLIARMLAAAAMLRLSMGGRYEVCVSFSQIVSWDAAMVKRILRLSIPSGIENGSFQLGRVLVSSIVALLGTTEIVATGVAYNFMGLGISYSSAVNLAITTVVGQCVGAGEYEQAVFYAKRFIKLAFLGTLCSSIVVTLLQTPVMGLYALSAQAKELAFSLTTLHNTIGVLLWPISFTLSYALRAAGDVRFTMVVSTVSMFALRVLFAYILGITLGFGVFGVWGAMFLDWVFRAAVFALRFKSGKWRDCRVL
ncbi:MAG: MATE family efflux transporter [Clostridiaceae bacterium]|nr:MATE family efflux transporter [Eubacteriales bacterium]